MVGAFADAVTTALGSGAEAFEHGGAVYEDGLNAEFAGFSFTFVFGFPVGDSAAEEFFNTLSSFFI